MLTFLQRYPSLWPLAFLFLFIPVFCAISRSRRLGTFLERIEPGLLCLWSLTGIGIFVFCDLAYLACPAFFDFLESCGVSIAHLVFHGGTAYPEISSAERYCLPYGPIFYLVLGASQWLFGPSTFASKLPCCFAMLASIALFWRILRQRGLHPLAALAFTGLTATIIVAIRVPIGWAKSDPLIFLMVITGIWSAFRRDRLGPILLGVCTGLAMGLKITAPVYFTPMLVIAFCTGWKRRDFALCLTAFLALFVLPFVLMPVQFPWANYLTFFRTVGREGFALVSTFNYLRWVAMLAGLVLVTGHFISRSTVPHHRRRRLAYLVALALGLALVAIPACAVGAFSYHLLPFVPLVLLSAGNLFDAGEKPASHYSRSPLAHGTACAILSGCALVAIQTSWQFVRECTASAAPATACQKDLRQIIARYPGFTILMGTAKGDESGLPAGSRHLLTWAGHPIGLDAVVVSDYQFGGISAPDLPRLLAELHQRRPRPVLWLLPRGGVPFTATNCYDSQLPIYPERFRTDFAARFSLRETTAFFDLYFPIREP